MVSICGPERANLGISSCGAAIPRDSGSRSARLGCRSCRLRNSGAFAFGLAASGTDRMTAAAVLLDERLAFPDARFRLRQQRRRNAESRQAVPGADQRGIEQERRLEIGNRIVLAALRLVHVAAVVVGERVHGIERDGRGVVVDRPRQIAGPAVGEAAAIEGARALRIEPERLREVGNRGRHVSFDEVRVAAPDIERGRAGRQAQGLAVVVDRTGDVAQRQTRPRPAGIARGIVGAKPDGLIEIGDGLRIRAGVGARIAAVAVGERLVGGAVGGACNDLRAGAQSGLRVAGLAAVGKRIGGGAVRRGGDDKACKSNPSHRVLPSWMRTSVRRGRRRAEFMRAGSNGGTRARDRT